MNHDAAFARPDGAAGTAAAPSGTVGRRVTLIVLTLIATVQFFDRALKVKAVQALSARASVTPS